MAFTVNINPPALSAIQTLTRTVDDLDKTQGRVSSGLEVSRPEDDAIRFAIANDLRGEFRGYESVRQSLDRASSALDIAIAAGEAISDLLIELNTVVAQAADEGLDQESRDLLRLDYEALRDRITTIIRNAEFNGTNLIDSGVDEIIAITTPDAALNIQVSHRDLTLGASTTPGAIIELGTSLTFTDAAEAQNVRALIDNSRANLARALAHFGAGAQVLETQRIFTDTISDTLEVGVGNLVDANLARESARLQSLQVKQQLGLQSLSIANSQPESVLTLFQ